MKRRFRKSNRILCLLLAMLLLFVSPMESMVVYGEGDPTAAPTESAVVSAAPEESPEETEAPVESPEETAAPTESPEETAIPTEGAQETAVPTQEPEDISGNTEEEPSEGGSAEITDQAVTLVSVDAIDGIVVKPGTDQEAFALSPTAVTVEQVEESEAETEEPIVTLPREIAGKNAAGEEITAQVTWSCNTYEKDVKGAYLYTAQCVEGEGTFGEGVEIKTMVAVAESCTCQDDDGNIGKVHNEDNEECPLYGQTIVQVSFPDYNLTFFVAEEDGDIYKKAGAQIQTSRKNTRAKAVLGAATSRDIESMMNNAMENFAKTDYPSGGKYGTGSAPVEEIGLTNEWRNYVNTIWQYKAMGSYDGKEAEGEFQWATPDGIEKWSGTIATEGHPWLSAGIDAATENEKNDIEDLRTRFGLASTPTDAGVVRAAGDPAANTPTMVPFSTLETKQYNGHNRKERTFYVWSGEQLIYALKYHTLPASGNNTNAALCWWTEGKGNEDLAGVYRAESVANNPKGVGGTTTAAGYYSKIKIVIMQDIDLDGSRQNWPCISMYRTRWPRMEFDGQNHTIYNFGQYRNGSNQNRAAGLVIAHAGLDVENLTFKSAKIVATTSSNAPAVGIFGKTEVDSTENPTSTKTYHWEDYGTSTIENLAIVDSMFFSGVEASNVSALGELVRNDYKTAAPAKISKTRVENCFIYGGDHAAGLSTGVSGGNDKNPNTTAKWGNSSITNTYVSDTLIATYGGHSGGFVSCAAKQVEIANCFSDIDMYAGAYSGGFLGLSSGTVQNCFSTGKLEGFRHCGGFLAAVTNNGVNQGLTVTDCYSTVLTGMRTESQNMGGFYAPGVENTHSSAWSWAIGRVEMKNCYAAGEVGDTHVNSAYNTTTNTDDTANRKATANCGGFAASLGNGFGTTAGSTRNELDTAENCYYDKQTTAMKEWISGNYNSRKGGPPADNIGGQVLSGVTGVRTRDYDSTIDGIVGGLVGENPEESGAGFQGFKNDQWVYSNTNYPQLKVFSQEEDGWSAKQVATVQKYSEISTSTVFLEAWTQGYEWNDEGVRSKTEKDYTEKDPDKESIGTHVGNKYSYDTVRDMIKNSEYSPSGKIQAIGLVNSTDGTVQTTDKTSQAGLKSRGNAFETSGHFINIMAPGMGWFGLASETARSIYRPLRLISTLNIEAGNDQFVYAGDVYDHRKDVRLSAAINIKPNLVMGLDDDVIWSETDMGGFSTKNLVPPETDGARDSYSKKFFQAASKNIDSYLDDENSYAIKDAWLNTEVWRVWQTFPTDMPKAEHVPEDGGTYEAVNALAEGVTYTEPTYPVDYPKEGGYYWWVDKDEDGNVGVYLRRQAGSTIDVNNDRYVDAFRVDLTSDPLNDNTIDKEKWRGDQPLYPDTASPKKYSISYYWVLSDGRYASDYKAVSIKPGYYNLYMNTYSYKNGQVTNDYNPYGVMLEPKADRVVEAEQTVTDLKWERQVDFTDNTTDASAFYGPQDAEGDISNLDNDRREFDGFTTEVGESIRYTDDGTTAWKLLNNDIVIKKIRLTMYARNGTVMGEGAANADSFTMDELKNGKVSITVPTEYYGVSTVAQTEDGETVESTKQGSAEVTYKVYYDDANDYYYISLSKFYHSGSTVADPGAMTPGLTPQEQTLQTGSGEGIITGDNPYINDTQYHVRVDLWVETYDLTVEKEITGNYGEEDAKFDFNVELTDLNMPLNLDRYTQYYTGTRDDTNKEGTGKPMTATGETGTGGSLTKITGYQMPAGDIPASDGSSSPNGIRLGDRETVTIRNLPVGIQYKITEFGGSTEYYKDYTTSVRVKGDSVDYSNKLKSLSAGDTDVSTYDIIRQKETDALADDGSLLNRPAFFLQKQTQEMTIQNGYPGGITYGMVAAGSNYVRYRNEHNYTVPTMVKMGDKRPYIWALLLAMAIFTIGGTATYLRVRRKRRRDFSSSDGL